MSPTTKPIQCYVTDRHSLPAAPLGASSVLENHLPAVIQRVISAGVDWVQIREKDLAGGALLTLARQAVAAVANNRSKAMGHAADGGRVRILVNDRLDVAAAAGADGVHLGEASLPVAAVAPWVREARTAQRLTSDFLVGVSCHSLETAQEAVLSGADYIFFGPVFATPSKAVFGPSQGLGRLREVCASVRIPVLAIGGITLENARPCIEAGAAGIAAIRLFQDTADPAGIVDTLRNL